MGLAASLLISSTAFAGTEDAWMQLDEEIASLSTNVAAEGGLNVSGTLGTFYTSDSDADIGGWEFEAVRLNFKAQFEQFTIKVSTELKSGTAALRDAFAMWTVNDDIQVTWGQFKRPFSYHHGLSVGKLLFSRNNLNVSNEARDNGAMVSGSAKEGALDWFLAAHNGTDGTTDDLRYTARVALAVAGEGAFRAHEGAIEGRDELDASVGVAYAHDKDAAMSFHKVGVEAAATMKGLYLAADIVDYTADDPATVLDATLGHDLDETTPYSLTGSYMLRDDIELAARYEDFDDGQNTDRTTIGVNFYKVLPHRAKWMVNYIDNSSDSAALDSEVIRVGLVLNF